MSSLDVQRVAHIAILFRLPLVAAIDLVQGNDKGTLLLPQELDRLECLLLKTVHQINNQDSNVAKTRATRSQIGKTLVARRINHQEAWQLQLNVESLLDLLDMALDVGAWKVGCTDLLRDSAGFTSLHVGFA